MTTGFVMLRTRLPCILLGPTLAGGVGDCGAAHHFRAEAWSGSSDTRPLLGLVGVVGCLGGCDDSSGAEAALVVVHSAVSPGCQLGHREAQVMVMVTMISVLVGGIVCVAAVQKRRLASCLDVFVSCRVSQVAECFWYMLNNPKQHRPPATPH